LELVLVPEVVIMANDIVVVGASAGGVQALKTLIRNLPGDLRSSLFVVLHVSQLGTSVLPQILNGAGVLNASHAYDGQPIERGQIYVAPPGFHALIERGRIALSRAPRENGHRPAIDPTFRSAAYTYGPRVLGILLSGNLDDGVAGLQAVKRHGGVAAVQDPDEADFPDMPLNAQASVDLDYLMTVDELSRLIVELAGAEAFKGYNGPPLEPEPLSETAADATGPLVVTCPDCQGPMWEVRNGELISYQCRTGHVMSPESLNFWQSEGTERALWAAEQSLRQKAALNRRMAEQSRTGERFISATYFDGQAEEAEVHAEQLQKIITDLKPWRPVTESETVK
jgi:two-component system chemotaxis response regulator CheB